MQPTDSLPQPGQLPPDRSVAGQVREEESARWIAELTAVGRIRDDAMMRLHDLLLRIGYAELRRRGGQHPVTGPELDDLAHQAADDALMAIVGKLGQFRGESRFTTWAYKFVILEVSAKLGRHFWQRPTVPLEGDGWLTLADDARTEQDAELRDLIAAVRRAMTEELTDRQRRVFQAIVVDRVPLDALVAQLGTSRGAVYKTMFDARRKLRASLVANGYLADEAPARPQDAAAEAQAEAKR